MFLTFQSSPALSGRCNYVITSSVVTTIEVSILTGPFGPVQRQPCQRTGNNGCVSILTGPFGPVQPHQHLLGPYPDRVSILTGPFGPVQRTRGLAVVVAVFVSILTGPFGPVQPKIYGYGGSNEGCFNPHRPFRAGATLHVRSTRR